MKEIKAYIHRSRIADVVHALKAAGYGNLAVIDVKSTLQPVTRQEQDYSVVLGTAVIDEMKLELVCEDPQVEEATRLIQRHARTGRDEAGWIYVIDIGRVIKIDANGETGG